MEKDEMMIWMQLLGFDRNDPDRGAARYLDQIGFKPRGIIALLYHPDIVNLHRGMDEEYRLFDDNAAYYAIPRNTERERQPWTNLDLRELARGLKKHGVGLYAGIMAPANDSRFHREWIEDHPEMRYTGMRRHQSINVLKRFRDGSYFEDFFAEKLRQTLTDYEMEGVQFTDMFCPSSGTRAHGDFSTDMTDQFVTDTGIEVPIKVRETMGDDSIEALKIRQEWLWSIPVRYSWLDFYARRWERFFEKICAACHSAGKKVMVLGQYCTDPFETLWCLGIDMRRLARAGVDEFCPNTLPTGVAMETDLTESRFWRYMTLIPLTSAFVPHTPLYTMLGTQDASEEWNVMKHAPVRFERDLTTEMTYRIMRDGEYRQASAGHMICLGDGIAREDWANIRRLSDSSVFSGVKRFASPALLWSDAAFDNTLVSYAETHRYTVHKTVYELANRGAPIGGVVRSEDMDSADCPLLIPCFDLMSPEEQRKAAEYPHPVICTAAPGFDPEKLGFKCDFIFADGSSPYPQIAFGRGAKLTDEIRELLKDTRLYGTDVAPGEGAEYTNQLTETLNFRAVGEGFLAACAALMKKTSGAPFRSECPFFAYELEDGTYRVFFYNSDPDHYRTFVIETDRPAESVKVLSSFPCLPTKFEKNGKFTYDGAPSDKFRLKLAPDGVTAAEIRLS